MLIQKLSLASQGKPAVFEMLTRLFNELKSLVPPNFGDLYALDRIKELPRYLACLKIRAQRTVDHPAKEAQKADLIRPFQNRLDTLVSSLTKKSSPEKAGAVEDFFWYLEEYKISVYAQELKTAFKVSAKRLDKRLLEIATMI